MSSKEPDPISHLPTRPPRHSDSVLSVSVVSPLRVSLAVATPRVSFLSPNHSCSVLSVPVRSSLVETPRVLSLDRCPPAVECDGYVLRRVSVL